MFKKLYANGLNEIRTVFVANISDWKQLEKKIMAVRFLHCCFQDHCIVIHWFG